MLEILEEMGITLGEIFGAGLVFAGVTVAVNLLSEYGFEFIQMLVG